MIKPTKKELFDAAQLDRRRCEAWLVQFMKDGQPKFCTKAELCEAAMKELKVSKQAFEAGWVWAIEKTGRQDWYEPLRIRRRIT